MKSALLTIGLLAAFALLPATPAAALKLRLLNNGVPTSLICNADRAQQVVASLGLTNIRYVVANATNYYFEGIDKNRADGEYAVSKLNCKASYVGECLGAGGLSLCPVHP